MSSRNPSSRPGRARLVLAFVVYLLVLTWVVLWKLEMPWIGEAAALARPVKLVPFIASGEAGASAPIEVAINLVIFVPFGLFLGVLMRAASWFQAAGAVLAASLALETTQHLISTGSFDTTDLIVNTAGGLIGYGIFAALRRRHPDRARSIAARTSIILTAVALAAVVAFVASPLHYGPQRDVVVQRLG